MERNTEGSAENQKGSWSNEIKNENCHRYQW